MDAEADVLAELFSKDGKAASPATAAAAASVAVPSGPRTSRAARPWIAFISTAAVGALSIFGGLRIAGALAERFWPAGVTAVAMVDALYTAAIFAPMLALSVVGARVMKSPGVGLGILPAKRMALGLGLGAAGLLLAATYAWVAEVATLKSAAPLSLWFLGGTLLTLLQSGAEEMLMRGWLQPVLAQHWRAWIAVLVSAALFSALHLLGGARTPLTLLNILLAGIFFGVLALRTGSLVAPIAAHFAWNWSEALVLGLDPNPGVGSFGVLFNLDLQGSALWGGSEEGLNSSLAVTFVLLALVILCGMPSRLKRVPLSGSA